MKKETAVLGFIIFAAAGFLIGRQTAGDAGDTSASKTATSAAKAVTAAAADSGGEKEIQRTMLELLC